LPLRLLAERHDSQPVPPFAPLVRLACACTYDVTMSSTQQPPLSGLLIVLGTRNAKKAEELIDHLAGTPVQLRTLADYPQAPEVIEDGATFRDNARKKAGELARALGQWVLGEDSGLAVDALGGRPGVYSARYAGQAAADEANNSKLLEELAGVPDPQRTAHYVSTMALADPQGNIRAETEGRCNGRIAAAPRGRHGFGYDPLFVIPEYHKTFGELGLLVKRRLSHRARAVARLRSLLWELVARDG
jgi:XTP/dITP diphosphohydrolase